MRWWRTTGAAPSAWNLADQLPQLLRRLAIINSPHPAHLPARAARQPGAAGRQRLHELPVPPGRGERCCAENDYARLWPFFTAWGGSGVADRRAKRSTTARSGRRACTGGCNYYRASPLRPPLGRRRDPTTLAAARRAVTVRVPTLVLWGEDDMALPPALLDGLDAFVPRAGRRARARRDALDRPRAAGAGSAHHHRTALRACRGTAPRLSAPAARASAPDTAAPGRCRRR